MNTSTLRWACGLVADISDHKLDVLMHDQLRNLVKDMRQEAQAAIASEPARIIVTVEGGVIQAIDQIPAGVTVEVWDFDTEGIEEFDGEVSQFRQTEEGDEYIFSEYGGGAS